MNAKQTRKYKIEGEQRYRYTLSLTSALDEGVWSMTHSGYFGPGKETRYPRLAAISAPAVS
jgi:hypothetical protein